MTSLLLVLPCCKLAVSYWRVQFGNILFNFMFADCLRHVCFPMSWVLSLTNLAHVRYDGALHTAKELLINSWFNPSWTSERTTPWEIQSTYICLLVMTHTLPAFATYQSTLKVSRTHIRTPVGSSHLVITRLDWVGAVYIVNKLTPYRSSHVGVACSWNMWLLIIHAILEI